MKYTRQVKTNILLYDLYAESLKKKKIQMNSQNINRPTDIENKFMVTKEKNKYHMILLICGIFKKEKDTNELIYKTEIDPQT